MINKQAMSNLNMHCQSRQKFVGFLDFFRLYPPKILGSFMLRLQKEPPISNNNLDTCLVVILDYFHSDRVSNLLKKDNKSNYYYC